jgi:hypothetical protein
MVVAIDCEQPAARRRALTATEIGEAMRDELRDRVAAWSRLSPPPARRRGRRPASTPAAAAVDGRCGGATAGDIAGNGNGGVALSTRCLLR